MNKKIYTAFISSAFNSLRDERDTVINCLLDLRVLPVGMEHFTIGNFSDIEKIIDDSDIFILLLGSSYGSIDETGMSWTEREYKYALKKHKAILAIVCDELYKNLKKPQVEISPDELRQIEFYKTVSFAREISPEFSIKTIITQFYSSLNLSDLIGWTRINDITKDSEALAKWKLDNSAFDISGIWYHVHLSEADDKYIRIGNVRIEQNFSPDTYQDLTIIGENYDIICFDEEENTFIRNEEKKTRFNGEYKLKPNGEIFGIFKANRFFKNGKYGDWDISDGVKRGIHDFNFDIYAEKTTRISGVFHDEAPSPKSGTINLFRSREARDKYIFLYRKNIFKQGE